MWSIAEIAARDGVSKPTVSVRVKRFVEQHGLAVERDEQGRVARLNVAEYDALRGQYADPSKMQAAPPSAASTPARDDIRSSESYDEALRQKTWLETERRRIELDQIKGRLVDAAAIADGYDRAAGVIQDVLGALEDLADDLAAVVGRDGARGLAPALRKLGGELQGKICAALRTEARAIRASISDDAPERPN